MVKLFLQKLHLYLLVNKKNLTREIKKAKILGLIINGNYFIRKYS